MPWVSLPLWYLSVKNTNKNFENYLLYGSLFCHVSPYIPFNMDTIRMLTFVVLLINIVNNADEEIIISHINLSIAFWQFQVMSHLFAIAPVDRQSAAICKQIGSSVTSYLLSIRVQSSTQFGDKHLRLYKIAAFNYTFYKRSQYLQ